MEKAAKIFKNGRNQAVRLPVQFEFDTDLVYIRQEENGDLIISKHQSRQDNWEQLFGMLEATHFPDNFLDAADRNQNVSTRDPFDEVE